MRELLSLIRKANAMPATCGRAKHMTKLKLQDFLKHPIWVSAHDDRHDEEWYKPITSHSAVTREVLAVDVPLIAIRVLAPELYGTAYYDRVNDYLFDVALWIDDNCMLAQRATHLQFPLTLVSIPEILGDREATFILHRPADHRAPRSERPPPTTAPPHTATTPSNT